MLNISESEKDLYRAGDVKKEIEISIPGLNITLTNADIVSESVSLTERIETEQNLSFKGCNSSIFQFQIAKFNQDIRGQYLEATIQAEDGVVLPLFSGYISDQTNLNHEDFVTEITCFDALTPIMTMDVTSWYNALTFPITLKNLRDRFFQQVGMTQETVTLVNDSQTVNKSITDKTITGGTILKAICQLNGRFGQYGRDKLFHYRKLGAITAGTYPGTDTFPSEDLYPSEPNANEFILKGSYDFIDYQPFETRKVSRVAIIGQNGAIKGQNGDTSKDTFWIIENKLAWGLVNPALVCANILNEIDEVAFTPAKINANGLPYLECGDIVTANTRINVVNSYILERNLTGIQALKDSFEGNVDEKRETYTPTAETEISANQSEINATKTTVSNVSGRVSSLEADHVSVSQLNATNARVGNIEANYISAGTVAANYATINSLNAVNARFNNLNANNITTGILSVSRLQGNSGANASWVQLQYLQSVSSGAVGSKQLTFIVVKRWALCGTYTGSNPQTVTVN